MTRPIQAGPSRPAQPMMRAPTWTSWLSTTEMATWNRLSRHDCPYRRPCEVMTQSIGHVAAALSQRKLDHGAVCMLPELNASSPV